MSIAGGADVTLSGLAGGHVLAYNATTHKWVNQAQTAALPAGGVVDQALAKASNADGDVTWRTVAPLTTTSPPVGASASAGTSSEAARADHQHDTSELATGYALQSEMYSSPIGIPGDQMSLIPQGTVALLPLPVFRPLYIRQLHLFVRTNNAGVSLDVSIYAAAPTTYLPGASVRSLPNVAANTAWHIDVHPSLPVALNGGMYWIGILPKGGDCGLTATRDDSTAYGYVTNSGSNVGPGIYTYNNAGAGYTALPSSFVGQQPTLLAQRQVWYQMSCVNSLV